MTPTQKKVFRYVTLRYVTLRYVTLRYGTLEVKISYVVVHMYAKVFFLYYVGHVIFFTLRVVFQHRLQQVGVQVETDLEMW